MSSGASFCPGVYGADPCFAAVASAAVPVTGCSSSSCAISGPTLLAGPHFAGVFPGYVAGAGPVSLAFAYSFWPASSASNSP